MAFAIGELHLSPDDFYKLKPNEFELIYIRHQQRKKTELEFTWYTTQVMAMSALYPGNKDVFNMVKNNPFSSNEQVEEKCLSFDEVKAISEKMDKQIEANKAKKNTKG